jgi:hypothetical protein
MRRIMAAAAWSLISVFAAAQADTIIVGGNELQALYPFRCC